MEAVPGSYSPLLQNGKSGSGCPVGGETPQPLGLGGDLLFPLHYIFWGMVTPARSQPFSPHPDSKF